MSIEAMKLALEALECALSDDKPYIAKCKISITALRQAIEQAHKQEPVAYVYRATTQQGEVAHFGEKSTARAWAKSGTVEFLPLKTLKLVQKPCASCESLARTVMLDQTSHDVQLQRKPMTDEEIQYALESAFLGSDEKRNWQDDLRVARAIEAAHGIKE